MKNSSSYGYNCLTEALRSGDEAAFRELFDLYRRRLYYFALRFVAEADAIDIVTEAFISVWQKRADFENIASLQHYLFVIVRNLCLKVVRHETVKKEYNEQIIHQLETATEEQLDLEHLTDGLVSHIYREVNKLPSRQREIFLLSFRDGLKPAEIAARLQVSVQTVSNQKLTAIKVLREILGPDRALLSLFLFFLQNPDFFQSR